VYLPLLPNNPENTVHFRAAPTVADIASLIRIFALLVRECGERERSEVLIVGWKKRLKEHMA
jgi:hypothetical protein